MSAGETSLRFNFLEGKNTVNPAMRKAAANATAMSAAMRVASAAAAVGMVTLGAAIVSAGAHLIALGQSAIVAAGALALMPSALAAVIGLAIAGKVAFGGLGEAWKQTGAAAKAGGAGVDVAHRMELANRAVRDSTTALADAQREALAAQEAVTRARETAAERLEDLSRSLRGAQIDERSAVESLRDARLQLAQARGSGDAAEVRKAKIAYDAAVLSLERARDSVKDLAKEQETAATQGVEGSSEVQSAIQRQEQAQRSLTAATERLADAQRELATAGKGSGGVDKAAAALAALAPSAREVVLELRAMGPAWVAAGKGAQQAAWAGVAGDLNTLGMQTLPIVSFWLRRMGEGFNLAFRETIQLASSRKFVADLGTSLEFIDQTTRRLGQSLRPFINGIMQFVTVGSSFLPGIASDIGSIAERFERWASAARESGRMNQWIGEGLAALKKFWAVSRDVVMTVVAIFSAGQNQGTLDGLVKGAAAMRAWAESAQGQAQIAGVLTFLRSILTDLGSIIPAVANNAHVFTDTLSVFAVVVSVVAGNLDTFAAVLPYLAAGYVLLKTAQVASTASMVVTIPMRIAEFIASVRQTAALWAHTAALKANTISNATSATSTTAHTTATVAGDVATKRSLAGLAALKVAQGASAVATGVSTVAQWALNTAWYGFPVVWVIAAIIALIAVIVLIIVYHEEIWAYVKMAWDWIWGHIKAFTLWLATDFGPKVLEYLMLPFRKGQEFVAWVWDMIKLGALTVHNWIVGKMTELVQFLVVGLPGRIRSGAANMWSSIVDSFKAMINLLIKGWNSLDFGISLRVPDWVPEYGGRGWSIPDIIPDLPYLDVGGRVKETGAAVIHKGEEVVTAAEVDRGRRSGGGVVTLRSDGSALSDWIIETLRKAVGDRGGDVQFVLGG